MKISKYTFLFDIENKEFYVYSTLSNSLIEIDNITYNILSECKNKNTDISIQEIEPELYDAMISKKIIVENDIDSFLFYKSIITTQRISKGNMHLTLAPTMDCCFRCHYCFEKYKEDKYMTEEVMDSVVKYLNQLDSKPDIRLTWFGGEPLMALPQMEQFYEKLTANYKKPIKSDVITTGFHINEDAIRILEKIGVSQLQITLDGLKDTHNNIKFTKDCEDVFSKVLTNIELVLKTSNIHVVFRVNLTKQNADEYVLLYNQLIKRFHKFKNYGISPAFVMNRGVCNNSDDNQNKVFFTHKDGAQFVLDLYNNYKIHSPFLHYPSNCFNECAIRNPLAMSFDPEGYAYKCWEVIGNKEYAIGILNDNGYLKITNEIIYNRHLYGADPLENPTCSECKYLPICHGGCPIQRLENVFDNQKNCTCTFHKEHLKRFLSIHLALKKTGYKNY